MEEYKLPRKARYKRSRDTVPCVVHGFFQGHNGYQAETVALVEFPDGEIAQVNPSYLVMDVAERKVAFGARDYERIGNIHQNPGLMDEHITILADDYREGVAVEEMS